jgi:hypothetical protein
MHEQLGLGNYLCERIYTKVNNWLKSVYKTKT